MTDFASARRNMINAQLEPNGIHNKALLAAYAAMPRETLVEEGQRPFVYLDEDVPGPATKSGPSWLLAPMIEARMVQAALTDDMPQNVLVLGAANLPAAAMLAQFSRSVLVIEPDAVLAAGAQDRLKAAGRLNVSVIEAGYREGYARRAPYDVIFMPGAVAAIPPALVDQLADGGRLVCVLRETQRAAGRIILVRRLDETTTETHVLTDAATPYLRGFEPSRDFVF